MGEIVLRTTIKWIEGNLYYCKRDENNNLTVYTAKMSRGGKKKKK